MIIRPGIVEFHPDYPSELPPDRVTWRLSRRQGALFGESHEQFIERFKQFVDAVGHTAQSLAIGDWASAMEYPVPVDMLTAAASRLPELRELHLADIPEDEVDISWILMDDITPLLEAFPRLEVLWLNGANGLALRPVRHAALRSLTIQSGGLPGHVVRAIGESELPALEHLELWLGVRDYGGSTTIADLAGILAGAGLPALRRLGVCDAEFADDVAAAVAFAPIVARLEELNLSLGTLSDAGVRALLDGQPLTHLRLLNVFHHFISDEMGQRLRECLPDGYVNLGGRQEAEDGERYVAASE